MSPESVKTLKDLLIFHEGFRRFPYKDTTGHETIGIGRNLVDKGISYSESLIMLDDDVSYFTQKLEKYFPDFSVLDDARKTVLIDMCFNLGINGLLQFKNMINAIRLKDWNRAALSIIQSKAHSQNPNRYQRLATIMKTGIIAAIQPGNYGDDAHVS